MKDHPSAAPALGAAALPWEVAYDRTMRNALKAEAKSSGGNGPLSAAFVATGLDKDGTLGTERFLSRWVDAARGPGRLELAELFTKVVGDGSGKMRAEHFELLMLSGMITL